MLSTRSPAMPDGEREGAAEEARKLLGSDDENDLLGFKMACNDKPWHYVFVLPLAAADETKMPNPSAAWNRIFTGAEETAPCRAREGMTRKEFHRAVFSEIVAILGGEKCGFTLGTQRSIDGDEIFLLVALENHEAVGEIAELEEFRAMLHPEKAYKDGLVCATDITEWSTGEDNVFTVDVFGEFLDGADHTNQFPGHVRFSVPKRRLLADFHDAELIRLTRRRIRKFVQLHGLITEGVVSQYFCVHRWSDLRTLREKKRWNDPLQLFQWPAEYLSDLVQNYFGPELGFFFHWFNLYTRSLLYPALISLPLLVVEHFKLMSDTALWELHLAFALVMAVWSTLFIARYKQRKNIKVLKWGMKDYDEAAAEVRRQFSNAYRDTCRDHLQQAMHWSLCILFMAETFAVVYLVNVLRRTAQNDAEGETFGFRHEHVAAYGKYIITLNIKLVDWIWTPLSTYLTSRENWRTRGELTSNMVQKLFAVKFVVFYYPFVYTILIKPHVSGCGGDGITPCFEALNADLKLFFISQIIAEAALLGYALISSWWKVRSERMAQANREYTYLEYQAKCPEYADADFINDFENQVLSYGFLVMFGVCLPYMVIICFLANFLFKRMLTYKVSYAHQRPNPAGAEGIGSWEDIVVILSFVGVIFNSYLAIFVLPVFKDYSFVSKLVIFLSVEHSLLLAKMIIDAAISSKSTAQKRIEEHHEKVIEKIQSRSEHLARDVKIQSVKGTKMPESPY